jgi:hypothetical protein
MMYAARLKLLRHQSRRFRSLETGCTLPKSGVQRIRANNDKPAIRKRVEPTKTGGQNPTRNFIPVLFAPHKKTVKRSPAAIVLF